MKTTKQIKSLMDAIIEMETETIELSFRLQMTKSKSTSSELLHELNKRHRLKSLIRARIFRLLDEIQ
jgi:hypothetical protein